MVKKAANKAEREHMGRVASMGCLICGRAATVHHITGGGMGRRSSHFETIPLCADHHQHGGYGVAIHAGQRTWEQKYGTQRELLEKLRGMLALRYPEHYS